MITNSSSLLATTARVPIPNAAPLKTRLVLTREKHAGHEGMFFTHRPNQANQNKTKKPCRRLDTRKQPSQTFKSTK